MPVQVIKATYNSPQESTKLHGDKKRVAAYCRVSTDSEEQETSYEAQCRHYTDYINSNPAWTLAGIYADEGISGTSTKHRDQFNRMIEDCENGLIDMVITKSISRWARNTIDSLKNIRRLKALGIPVIFEKENVNTMGAGGEVMITILSSIAQQESDSISKNVRMGIQYQFQQGKGRGVVPFGYKKVGDHLEIVPEEATLVRRIFREYLEGYSPSLIAAHLTADQIPTPGGKDVWYPSTVVTVLENEKYAGDMLMQKYFTEDFLTHKVARNIGQLPQYFVEDAHPAIVPREIFYQVQGEMQRRRALKYEPARFRFGAADALKGRLVCGCCGRKLKRYVNPDPSLTDWRCRERAYRKKSLDKEMSGACPCRNVLDKDVKKAILAAFNELPQAKDDLTRMINTGEIGRIDAALEGLKEQMDRHAARLDELSPDDPQASFLKEQLEGLEELRTDLILQRAEAANAEVQVRLLLELIEPTPSVPVDKGGQCTDYDEFFRLTRYKLNEDIIDSDGNIIAFSNDMVIRYLENVIVKDDGFDVVFKCGLVVRACF